VFLIRIRSELQPAQPKIVILLATRNGADFLPEQLESFRAQTYDNWELLVSDDGSTDGTVEIVSNFAKTVAQRVDMQCGPQQGFWRNFVSLVRSVAIDGDLFAYSDQDDIWHPEKLTRAAAWFAARQDAHPALYCTRTELITGDGMSVGFSPLFGRAPTFRNALVQNIGGGNTMVFNRAALLALRATPVDADLISHDWWTYQLVTGVGGVAYYDPWPSLKYRQHGQNLVGSNIGLRARVNRLWAFVHGRVVMWNGVNLAVLKSLHDLLTPQNAIVLDYFAEARQASWPLRLYLVWKSGVYRQSILENFGLFLGALFGHL
jgi:glycosyltransferase involved in cell wall biosynthesis